MRTDSVKLHNCSNSLVAIVIPVWVDSDLHALQGRANRACLKGQVMCNHCSTLHTLLWESVTQQGRDETVAQTR